MNDAILVVDIPDGTTAEEAQNTLNALGAEYFLLQVLPMLGGHRCFLRKYKQTATKAETESSRRRRIR